MDSPNPATAQSRNFLAKPGKVKKKKTRDRSSLGSVLGGSPPSRNPLQSLTVVELKDRLKEKNLASSGERKELMKRLEKGLPQVEIPKKEDCSFEQDSISKACLYRCLAAPTSRAQCQRCLKPIAKGCEKVPGRACVRTCVCSSVCVCLCVFVCVCVCSPTFFPSNLLLL